MWWKSGFPASGRKFLPGTRCEWWRMGTRAAIVGILPLVRTCSFVRIILDGGNFPYGADELVNWCRGDNKSLAQLPGEWSRLAIAFIGAPKLHPAEPTISLPK